MRDLSLHLLDILQNSISAKADNVSIELAVDTSTDKLALKIADNGIGMNEKLLKSVTDPFTTTRTSRKVGLGISLLKASAERAGGELMIQSSEGNGTTISANFSISNIDRLPLGDLTETICSIIAAYMEIEIDLTLINGSKTFQFSTIEIKKQISGIPINHYDVLEWIREFINEGITTIFGGVLNEIVSGT
ncbi:MAG: ATP-binding protein [Bacillota bacterium]|nr:ATP-binding protein [Bacillota bacterium]